MRRSWVLIAFILSLNCTTLVADPADLYSGWAGAFSGSADPNSGLTSFPTLLVPLGGIYEGMGTASTALAIDTGFIESNPAASSLLQDTELAFYHHSWIADSNLEGVVYAVRFNDFGLGIGGKFLYIPFTAYNDWGAGGAKGYVSESIGTLNLSYNLFQTYYFQGLALGANFKVGYRNIPVQFSTNQSAIAFLGDVGVMTGFNFLKFYPSRVKNFSLGVAVKNLGISTLPDEQFPLLASAGIAYAPLRPWVLSCDFNLPISLNSAYPAERWNVAVGTNVDVTDFLSIQAGFLMKADNPRLTLGTSIGFGLVSFVVNYNLDLSGQLNPVDKFSVQAKLNLGDFGRVKRQNEVEEVYLLGVKEYANGNYLKAIGYWKKVLELDPEYIPARENIDTVQDALDLQKEMESRGE